jgi:DUF917 family protein
VKEFSLNREDIPPLLEGLAILGTGGGGNPEWGQKIMENDLARGRKWRIIPLDEVPDDWTVVCGGIMGSVKALEDIGFDTVLENWESNFPLLIATQYMEELLNRKIDAVVPFEAGGLNSPVILTLTSRMGIPTIDADALGRSAPETQMTSWYGHGIDVTPMPLADSMGNIVVVSKAREATYADEVGRFVVTKGGYLGANNHHPMTGAQAKDLSIPGTFSKSLELGRAVLKARESGDDPVVTVQEMLKATHLIHGRIDSLLEKEHMGFYFTTARLSGIGKDEGKTLRLVIKNEAMACFIEDQPVTIFPDPIHMLEPETGRGYMSVELHEGLEVIILGRAAHPRLRQAATTQNGRKAFSPTRYGEATLEFMPMEELVAGPSK